MIKWLKEIHAEVTCTVCRINETFSTNMAEPNPTKQQCIKTARQEGWKIGKKTVLCPACRNGIKELKQPTRGGKYYARQ